LPSANLRLCCLALYLGAASRLFAQETPPAAGSAFNGFNAGVTIAGVHDAYVGWYNAVTPALSYSFSPRYSADVSMSIYPYRYAPDLAAATSTTDTPFIFAGGDLADMLIEVHATFEPGQFSNVVTASMALPTGDRNDGLGTGRVTFNLDNRIEHYVGRTGFLLDIGGGNSSAFANRLVTEDDAALGPLAQFQTGILTWLTRDISLQSIAYEQLPIGDQKTYRTVFTPRGPAVEVTGHKVTEDNGFTTSLFVPLNSHTTWTTSYNHSLRLRLNTVSFGFTFTWKSPSQQRGKSLIDRAIREAESTSPTTRQQH
jgi:hypothetical protein